MHTSIFERLRREIRNRSAPVSGTFDGKHIKYANKFKPNDIFFGCGIENETYLIFDKFATVTGKQVKENTKQERYSIDYYKNFKAEDLVIFYSSINDKDEFILPIHINAHTLEKCDKFNKHRTTYCKPPTKVNTKFSGTTILDLLLKNEAINRMHNREFCFDGDSIEFMTLNFYKTTVDACVTELKESKKVFINELSKVFDQNKIFKNYGKVGYQNYNYGFAKFASNLNNISICNSGTYHINITLPTEIDNKCNIKDPNAFKSMHMNSVRAIQWIEPLLIACYGSGDIFSIYNDRFAKGSQRCALSRYIGLGTYDTKLVQISKLLNSYDYSYNKGLWYNRYHAKSGYAIPSTIGFDINFNKFKNHGIEIRIFDYFPEDYLQDVMNMIVLACEFSLKKKIRNPLHASSWHDTAVGCIESGYEHNVCSKFINEINSIFDIKLTRGDACEILQALVNHLFYLCKDGSFASKISPNMKRPTVYNFNKISLEVHRKMMDTEGTKVVKNICGYYGSNLNSIAQLVYSALYAS
jgi:hypothetical protein